MEDALPERNLEGFRLGDAPTGLVRFTRMPGTSISSPSRFAIKRCGRVTAIERDRRRCEHERAALGLKARFESLSLREREIMTLVTTGLMNKQVATELGPSEITVKIHRGNGMRKMGTKSLADLLKMAGSLETPCTKR